MRIFAESVVLILWKPSIVSPFCRLPANEIYAVFVPPVCVQHPQQRRKWHVVQARCVRVVHRRPVRRAAEAAGPLSDVRGDCDIGPGTTDRAGRAVAGPAAGHGRGRQGTVAGRAVRPVQPAGQGVRRVLGRGPGGGDDDPRVDRTAGRDPGEPPKRGPAQ